MPKAIRTRTTSRAEPLAVEQPNGPRAASGPTPALSVLDAARALQALDNARNRWDEHAAKLSDAAAERAEKARDRLDDQRDALHDYVLASRAATLAEALAQVNAALRVADWGAHSIAAEDDDKPEMFEQLLRVLASISGVLIREAGIEPAEVCGRFALDAVAREFPYLAEGAAS